MHQIKSKRLRFSYLWNIFLPLTAFLFLLSDTVTADAPDVEFSLIELQDTTVASGYGAALSINEQNVLVGRIGRYNGASVNVYVPAAWYPDNNDYETYSQTVISGTHGSGAQDINYYGQYVGNINGTAFYYDNTAGGINLLTGYKIGDGGISGGYLETGKSINNNGQIALTGDDGHGYIFDLREGDNGNITYDLGDLEGGHLIAINSQAQAIGIKNEEYFFWDPVTGIKPIAVDDDTDIAEFAVTAINDQSVAVGYIRRSSGVLFNYFFWNPVDGFTYHELPDWVDGRFEPMAINNQGWVVGVASASGRKGALYYEGELYNLEDFMPASFDGFIERAYDINENGWIAAGGWGASSRSRAVLLKPTWNPPPPPDPYDGVHNFDFETYDTETDQFEAWSVNNGTLSANPSGITPFSGELCAGVDSGNQVVFSQILDLKGIEDWIVYPSEGGTILYKFIKYSISAMIANPGGADVSIELQYLPASYNKTDYITGGDTAWQSRQWTPVFNDDPEIMAYTSFTNNGGDVIDMGSILTADAENTTASWREMSFEGWLPRVRWIRLRIVMDASADTGSAALEDITFEAASKELGPYSGFGYLPEAIFPESPDAPDKPVPGWVGPEGDGISGGYTGITLRNYVNPAFAGFADNYTNYDNSGQYIYMGYDEHPEAITGRPWNDSGWNEVIITLGDMELSMLADCFSPSPSGDFHPGEITAVFNETPITNGEGHDFVTFENGFVEGWATDKIFAELAYVEVSSNGTDFVRFPTHSLTPEWPGAYGTLLATGVFGMTGKHVNAYGDAWGTPFDLEWLSNHPMVLDGTVDLMDIRYVKQVDIPGGGPEDAQGSYTGLFHDSYGNVIFDAWLTWGSGGVDLDAVGVLNSSAQDSDGDHIVDYWDNCPQTANANQYDTDGDGYGNACDCDINGEDGGDGVVGLPDYSVFRRAYGSHGPERIPGEPGEDDTYTEPSENWNADADFNGDNAVGLPDYSIFRRHYGNSAPFE